MQDSNLRPHQYQWCALPTELIAHGMRCKRRENERSMNPKNIAKMGGFSNESASAGNKKEVLYRRTSVRIQPGHRLRTQDQNSSGCILMSPRTTSMKSQTRGTRILSPILAILRGIALRKRGWVSIRYPARIYTTYTMSAAPPSTARGTMTNFTKRRA